MVIKNPASILFSILFGLGLVLPTILQPMKAVLLLMIYMLIASNAQYLLKRMSLKLYFLSFALGSFAFIWSIYGLIVDNPGAMRTMTVMTIYPMILPFLTVLYKEDSHYSLHRLFVFFAWILVVLDLLYIFLTMVSPNNFLVVMIHTLYVDDTAVVDSESDYFKFTLPNVATLIFMIPYFVSAIFFKNNKYFNKGLGILIFFVLVVGVLSGRRAIFLTAFLGPVVAYLFTFGAKTKGAMSVMPKLLGLSSVIIAIYMAATFVNVDFFVDQANSISNFTTNESNLARAQQYDSLWRGIDRYPVFGAGSGAAADVSRSSDMPWAYELFYLAIIFQYGFFGFSLYLLGMLVIFYYFIKIIRMKGRDSFEFYFFSGFISFMVASATNPYLGKFDYMWVIFIPFAVISHHLFELKSKSKRLRVNVG